MALDHLHRIVVEGPIGVGKTSLAHKLADHLRADLLLEAPQTNPFLERFYREPERYALQVQLAFLIQRNQQMQAWHNALLATQRTVGDFLFAKDRLFAALTLPDDELALYDAMAAALKPPAQRIDLVIALQATPAALLARIAKRGIAYESAIDADYLQRLCDGYGELFHRYDDAPVLIVDTAHFNPIDSDDDFRTLLERIEAMRGRKAFLNLAAS
jgi:deoxyadenosine/deoxycytidine kinase